MGSKKGAGMWEACALCPHPHSNLSNKQHSSSTPNLQQPIVFRYRKIEFLACCPASLRLDRL